MSFYIGCLILNSVTIPRQLSSFSNMLDSMRSRLFYFLHALVRFIDHVIQLTGKLLAWLVLFLVLLVSYDVAMRYGFNAGSIALQELEWHVFSMLFLLGAAYTLQHDEHVRVDLLYNSAYLSNRHRAWINLFGGLFLLIPFCLLIIISSLPFVDSAWQIAETSPDPGGLAWRWFPKAMLPLGFSLLLLQGISQISQAILILFFPFSKPSKPRES